MKYLFYIDPMSYNNLSLYDYSLLSNIDNDKFTINYYCSKYYDSKTLENVRTSKIFKYNKIKNNLGKAISYIYSLFLILIDIYRFKPDIIHIQWTKIIFFDYIFLLLARLRKSKVVFTAHNVLPHNYSKKYDRSYSRYYKKVDKIIVHTSKTKSELIELFSIDATKIEIVPHGLLTNNNDLDIVQKIKSKLLQNLHLQNKVVFSSLGLQSKYKGFELLKEVWTNTPELNSNNHIQLLIVGRTDNISFDDLAQFDNVTIIDRFVDNNEFIAFTQLSDVVLLPYISISQSGVLLTVLNESIPVMVSSAGGLSDPLDIAKVGWNIGKADYENVKKGLLFLSSHNEEIHDIKRNKKNWDKIRQFYSWDKISSKTLSLYRTMS